MTQIRRSYLELLSEEAHTSANRVEGMINHQIAQICSIPTSVEIAQRNRPGHTFWTICPTSGVYYFKYHWGQIVNILTLQQSKFSMVMVKFFNNPGCHDHGQSLTPPPPLLETYNTRWHLETDTLYVRPMSFKWACLDCWLLYIPSVCIIVCDTKAMKRVISTFIITNLSFLYD